MDESPVDIDCHLLSHSALLPMDLQVLEPALKFFFSISGFSGYDFAGFVEWEINVQGRTKL
jgi:hypothetical protein